jgi:hypothetical protein
LAAYHSLLTDFHQVRPNSQMGDNAMKSTQTQAWGWLAAGVLALGLNGVYQDGGAAWLHRNVDCVMARIADRSGPVLALALGRVDWFMARANLAVARNETASCRMSTALARMHTGMARAQNGFAGLEAMSAREEGAMARLEANRARIEAQTARVRFWPAAFDAGKIPVICPRVRVEIPRINIPEMPLVRISAPVVQVEGLGPI